MAGVLEVLGAIGGNSLVSVGGSIVNNLISNKAKKIEGDYAVQLQRLRNDNSISLAQFQTKLAEIEASKAYDLQELSNERSKTALIAFGVIILGLGLIVVAIKRGISVEVG